MRSMGLDVGDKRTGIAVSDPLGILATPLLVLEHTDTQADIAAILKIVREQGVEKIIVGLPHSMDGSIGIQAEKVKAFTELLKQRSPVSIEFRDERLTTVSAKRLKQESGTKKAGKKSAYDAIAAAIILQSYLDEDIQRMPPPD
jgi:putative holliday junction resolvase